jgi:hypothetical protein
LFAQLAFAKEDEPHVGQPLHDDVRGLDEVALAFVRHQCRDVAHDRSVVREEEHLVDVHGRDSAHVIDVDALVYGDRALVRHAIGHEHLPDRLRCRDEAVHLAVLPPRERVPAQMKIDP